MPIYEIQSPDGRTFELEGDSAPNEQELEQVYQSLPQLPQELPDKENPYTGLEKFIVGASRVVPSIAGGILGAPAGIPGIVAGGAVGAGGGSLLADRLEEVFGGKARTVSESLKRAGVDAAVDAAFTVGTLGVGKALKVTGLDKPLKAALKKPFVPIVKAIRKTAEPVFARKAAEKIIKKETGRIIKLDNTIKKLKNKVGKLNVSQQEALDAAQREIIEISNRELGLAAEKATISGVGAKVTDKISLLQTELSKRTDDITKQTLKASTVGLKNVTEGLGSLSDEVTDIIGSLAPQLDEGMKQAEETIQQLYTSVLKTNGDDPVALNTVKMIQQLDAIPMDDGLKQTLKNVIEESTGGVSIPKEIQETIVRMKKEGFPQNIIDQTIAKASKNLPTTVGTPKVTVAIADNIKRTMDDVIGSVARGDKAGKTQLDKLIKLKDSLINTIDDATKGTKEITGATYKELSDHYSEYLRVGSNIDSALGKVGTGLFPEQRGASILSKLAQATKNLPPEKNVLDVSREFLGKLNSQANLLDDIDMPVAANALRKNITKLTNNLLKQSDYKAIEKVFTEINKELAVGSKVGVSELKKILTLTEFDELPGKSKLQSILAEGKEIRGINKKIEVAKRQLKKVTSAENKTVSQIASNARKRKEIANTLEALNIQKTKVIRPIEKKLMAAQTKKGKKEILMRTQRKIAGDAPQFNTHMDKFVPFILASTLRYSIPAVGGMPMQVAAIYTLWKLRRIGAHAAIRTIERLGKSPIMALKISQEQKILIAKFISGMTNSIRNNEDF